MSQRSSTHEVLKTHAMRTLTYAMVTIAGFASLLALNAGSGGLIYIAAGSANAAALLSGGLIGLTAEVIGWFEYASGNPDAFSDVDELEKFADVAADLFDVYAYLQKLLERFAGNSDVEVKTQIIKSAEAVAEYRSAKREKKNKTVVVAKALAMISEIVKFLRLLVERTFKSQKEVLQKSSSSVDRGNTKLGSRETRAI